MQDMSDGEELVGAFKGAMRRLASGVAIAVALGPDGPSGMAATSITSLTMEPPAILLCVNQSASLHACLSPGVRLSVNLLSRGQKDISAAFGGGLPKDQRFTAGRWAPDPHGVPMLEEAQANMSCAIDSMFLFGTHSIVIARVDGIRLSEGVDPLIFQNGGYL
jgi:flavin reductase (DIM6/NTAB) family NADH-FMN oxidoreductase RutF